MMFSEARRLPQNSSVLSGEAQSCAPQHRGLRADFHHCATETKKDAGAGLGTGRQRDEEQRKHEYKSSDGK
jgi:hypothetical protein